MKKVLVIGGTGLLGSHTVKELLGRGSQVTIMARKKPVHKWMLDGTQYMYGDYIAGDYDRKKLAEHDGLVFSVCKDWRDRPKEDAWEYFRRYNVEATARVFRDAAEAGIRRAVLISSYYHATLPHLVKTIPYVWSRAETENAVLKARGRMNVSILQPPWIMGPNSGVGLTFGELVTKMARGSFLWAIPGGTTWLSGKSLAYAAAEALERGKDGERYLLGDEFVTWARILETFSRFSGRERKAFVVPRPVMKMVGSGAYWYLKMKGVRSTWDERVFVGMLCSEVVVDAERARRSQKELGYPINDIERAMRETYDYCSALTPVPEVQVAPARS